LTFIVLVAICIYWNLNKEQRLNEEVEIGREKGLVQTWGTRVNSPRTLAHARNSFDNSDSDLDHDNHANHPQLNRQIVHRNHAL